LFVVFFFFFFFFFFFHFTGECVRKYYVRIYAKSWCNTRTRISIAVVQLTRMGEKRKLYSLILVINQLDAQNPCFIISLLCASTCFEHYVLIIRRSKFYYTASGIITSVGGHFVHRLREDGTRSAKHQKRCTVFRF